MASNKVASKLDNAYIVNNVLVLQYLVVTRVKDGRYQAQHDVHYFRGAAIEKELASNTEARDYLSMKIEAQLEGTPEPIASAPTFELADLKHKGSSDV